MPTKNSKSKKFILKINSIPTKTLDIQLKSNLFKQLEKYQNQQFFHPSVEVDGILSNNVKTNTNDFFYFASFSHTNLIVSLYGERLLIVIDYLANGEEKVDQIDKTVQVLLPRNKESRRNRMALFPICA